jgi:hypothetical protein
MIKIFKTITLTTAFNRKERTQIPGIAGENIWIYTGGSNARLEKAA